MRSASSWFISFINFSLFSFESCNSTEAGVLSRASILDSSSALAARTCFEEFPFFGAYSLARVLTCFNVCCSLKIPFPIVLRETGLSYLYKLGVLQPGVV